MGSRTIQFEKHPMLDLQQRALLYEVVRELAGRMELDELLGVVITKAKQVLGAESAALLFWDADSDELYFPYIADVDAEIEERFRQVRFPADRGIAGWVLRHGEPELVLDVRKDPRWYGEVDRRSGMKTMSLLCAPLRGRYRALGVIQLRNKREGEFTRADLELLDALAASVAGAIEAAQAFEQAQRRSETLEAQLVAIRRGREPDARFSEIVGDSAAMQRVFQLMESALATPVPVLLQGETGTGKGMLARAIHENGSRRAGPFVTIDCTALQESLIESLLFGHRKGSFTGAFEDRAGFFEVADGGTVFLDEIGNMPLHLQGKLLRVLQERQVVRVGDALPTPVDVRIISATLVDLEQACREGTFREDLYFRLATYPIGVPPLRDRREDIPALAHRLLQRATQAYDKPVAGFTPRVLSSFAQYDWPGNVRELQNEIERAVTLAPLDGTIEVAHLSPKLGGEGPHPAFSAHEGAKLKEAVARFESQYIRQVLASRGGNVTAAAAVLGISRTGMHKKLRGYDIGRARGASQPKSTTPSPKSTNARK